MDVLGSDSIASSVRFGSAARTASHRQRFFVCCNNNSLVRAAVAREPAALSFSYSYSYSCSYSHSRMNRIVRPELLDDLPPEDPRAIRSRRDLRRLNRIMGHARVISQSLIDAGFSEFGRRIVDLGSGDGTFCLRLIRHLPVVSAGQVVIIDRFNLVTAETRNAFSQFGWQLTTHNGDIFEQLAQLEPQPGTAAVANLFLHHFSDQALGRLLQIVVEKCDLLVACEPRRSLLALTASKLVGLVGCGPVTRHDAIASVRAGFIDGDLTKLWRSRNWNVRERRCGLFSHCFVAMRHTRAGSK